MKRQLLILGVIVAAGLFLSAMAYSATEIVTTNYQDAPGTYYSIGWGSDFGIKDISTNPTDGFYLGHVLDGSDERWYLYHTNPAGVSLSNAYVAVSNNSCPSYGAFAFPTTPFTMIDYHYSFVYGVYVAIMGNVTGDVFPWDGIVDSGLQVATFSITGGAGFQPNLAIGSKFLMHDVGVTNLPPDGDGWGAVGVIPEPSSILMLGMALSGIFAMYFKKKK